MKLFVNGELMQGLSMHESLRGAEFVGEACTAPVYRLFSVDNRYPAMVRAENYEQGYAVRGEIYDVPEVMWPNLFENERRLGLYRGSVWLADGTAMAGILCVRELCENYQDISPFGGWRKYCESLT